MPQRHTHPTPLNARPLDELDHAEIAAAIRGASSLVDFAICRMVSRIGDSRFIENDPVSRARACLSSIDALGMETGRAWHNANVGTLVWQHDHDGQRQPVVHTQPHSRRTQNG